MCECVYMCLCVRVFFCAFAFSSYRLEIIVVFCFFVDTVYEQFLGDEFLRLMIIRFVFCYETLRLHKGFKV